MEDLIAKDLKRLDALSKDRMRNLSQYTLDYFLNKVESQKKVLESLMSTSTKRKEYLEAVKTYITTSLVEISDNNFAVPHYSLKQKGEQVVYLYTGCHWEHISCQMYYDFIRDAARKMGLEDMFCDDPEFMADLYHRFVYTISHGRKTNVPAGDMWINLLNGTLEINKEGQFKFREHRKEDFFTYVLPYPYDPNAKCPLWHKFLDEVLPEP